MIQYCCSTCNSLPHHLGMQIIFSVSQLLLSTASAGTDFNVVAGVDWHVSVLYHDPYSISGTWMDDGMIDNSMNASVLDTLYLHLSIALTDDWVPFLNFSISRAWDGSLPLSNKDISELGILVEIEP
jgi:hypothetical protein